MASFLLPAHSRPAVMALYRFARHADDIADDLTLDTAYKTGALEQLRQAILQSRPELAPPIAQPAIIHALRGDFLPRHLLALLDAFTQDITLTVVPDWDNLRHYCQRSAAPIGRAMLELHHAWQADMSAADSLCTALQLLNHLQDLRADITQRQRCYFPLHWFGVEAMADILTQPESAATRQGIAQVLARVEALLEQVTRLPATLHPLRLRMEICTILACARTWVEILRTKNPLVSPVTLHKKEKLRALFQGLWHGITTRVKVPRTSLLRSLSRSSFGLAILRLSKDRKSAMARLYQFCRMLDDAVDAAPTPEIARTQLGIWDAELTLTYSADPIAYPTTPPLRALLPVIQRYRLPESLLLEMLAGQVMDTTGEMLCPSEVLLERYCTRVAGCVGLLSIRIFGCVEKASEDFALHLGHALQLTNILRDVREDATRGRIYLPKELLEKAEIPSLTPTEFLHAKGQLKARLGLVQLWLKQRATAHFRQADAIYHNLPASEQTALTPARQMQARYAHILRTL